MSAFQSNGGRTATAAVIQPVALPLSTSYIILLPPYALNRARYPTLALQFALPLSSVPYAPSTCACAPLGLLPAFLVIFPHDNRTTGPWL